MGPRRQDRTRSVLRGAAGAALIATAAAPLAAGPIATIRTGADVAMPEGYVVLDIRDADACFDRSPPGARCMPTQELLYGDAGAPVGFHALRWALGTLALTGDETLVIYPGDTVAQDDALAAAALLYLTGQTQVLLHDGPALETDEGGLYRALWRDVIYTAPIRTEAMRVADAPAGRLRDRLKDFATGGDIVAFAAGD